MLLEIQEDLQLSSIQRRESMTWLETTLQFSLSEMLLSSLISFTHRNQIQELAEETQIWLGTSGSTLQNLSIRLLSFSQIEEPHMDSDI